MNDANDGVATGGAFASAFAAMREAGFAVLPTQGKKPIISGFSRWSSALSLETLAKLSAKHPEADIAYLPGLSRPSKTETIIVLDADDMDADARIIELFGVTPGRVKTRRGRHHLYRIPRTVPLPTGIASLKAYGLNADIKHGRSIVVAPPSGHEKDPAITYAWDDCDLTVIKDLALFPLAALEELIGTRIAARESHAHSFRRPWDGHNVTNTAGGGVRFGGSARLETTERQPCPRLERSP